MTSVLGFDLGEQNIVSAKWKIESRGNGVGGAEVLSNDFYKRLTPYDMESISSHMVLRWRIRRCKSIFATIRRAV